MASIEEALAGAGLSKIEVDCYLAVLANAPISAGKVAKFVKNYRPNIYQAIERLKARGLVGEVPGKNAILFEALSPRHLLDKLNKQKSDLEQVVPQLDLMRSTSVAPTQMRILYGVNGWRHLLNEFIGTGKERVVYGIPKEVDILKEFFEGYHKKRAKLKIPLRHLFNYEAKERIKQTNRLPYTKSRYLPKEFSQPVSTSICGSLVALTVYQGKDITTLVIDNKVIADAYRQHFEFLWKFGKGEPL